MVDFQSRRGGIFLETEATLIPGGAAIKDIDQGRPARVIIYRWFLKICHPSGIDLYISNYLDP